MVQRLKEIPLPDMPQEPTGVREIETTTLPNGVRVISETMPHVRSVSVGLWVGTGSRRESPEQNGLSRSEEHTSELQSPVHLVCRLLLEKKKKSDTLRPPLYTHACCAHSSS